MKYMILYGIIWFLSYLITILTTIIIAVNLVKYMRGG